MARSSIGRFEPWCSNLHGNQSVKPERTLRLQDPESAAGLTQSRVRARPLKAEPQLRDVHAESRPSERRWSRWSSLSGPAQAINMPGARAWQGVRKLDLKWQEGKAGPWRCLLLQVYQSEVLLGHPLEQAGRRRAWAQTGGPAGSFLRSFRQSKFTPSQEKWPTPQVPGWRTPGRKDECEARWGCQQQQRTGHRPLRSTCPAPGRLASTAQALPPGILRPPSA